MSQGVGIQVGALIVRIDFPMPLKLINRSRRNAASFLFSPVFVCSFGRLASGFGRSRRYGSHAFAIGFAVDDKLVGAVTEAV
jgi:hypothetical protein